MGDALAAVTRRLGAVAVAASLVGLIVMIGFVFLVIPGIVAAVFLMFTLPAVLLDGLGAVDAMRRSAALVRTHVGPVIGFVVGCLLVFVGMGIASWILSFVPFLGGLASFVLQGAAMSYLTVVGVHFYGLLRATPGHRDGGDRPVRESLEARRVPRPVVDPASGARLPGRGLRASLHDAARAARRDDPRRPVHGRAREPGDPDPLREVPARGGLRRAPIPPPSKGRSDRPVSSGPRPGRCSAWRGRWWSGTAARCRGRSRPSRRCPGVGRKTANVVLGNAFGVPGIAVDTHVFRVTQRLGLAKADDPDEVEAQLAEVVPRAQVDTLLPPHPGPRPPGVPRPGSGMPHVSRAGALPLAREDRRPGSDRVLSPPGPPRWPPGVDGPSVTRAPGRAE